MGTTDAELRALEQIDALLLLDVKGALVPPLPGHALTLLNTAAEAIRARREEVAALRRERDEAMAGLRDEAEHSAWLKAENARMAAALREAHAHLSRRPPNNRGWNALLNEIERALPPDAPGEWVGDKEYWEAPASPSPGLREAVIEECAKVGDRWAEANQDAAGIAIANAIRALSAKGGESEWCLCSRCSDDRAALNGWTGFEYLGHGNFRYACEICGNKRCPHHSWHGFKCTGSNEPGQTGEPMEEPRHD